MQTHCNISHLKKNKSPNSSPLLYFRTKLSGVSNFSPSLAPTPVELLISPCQQKSSSKFPMTTTHQLLNKIAYFSPHRIWLINHIWCRPFPPPWNFISFPGPTLSWVLLLLLLAPSWVLVDSSYPQLLKVGVSRLPSSLAALISWMTSYSLIAANITYSLISPKCTCPAQNQFPNSRFMYLQFWHFCLDL